MDIKRIANIIGYSDSTLRKHVRKGHLFATMQDRKYLVSKYSLIIKRNEAANLFVSEWAQIAPRWLAECEHSA